MVQSKGWDWENANQAPWLKPTEDSYYLAIKWKEKGYVHLLDLGSGLGRHAIHFAKQGFQVNAIDISAYGIEHLKSWAAGENLTVGTTTGDILELCYPDGSFDCVFAYHVISHSDTTGIRKIISEIKRVMKPEGEAFLSFCSKNDTRYLDPDAKRADENTIISTTEPEVGVPHFFADLNDIIGLLKDFNIEKVRLTEYCDIVNVNTNKRHMYYYVNATLK